MRATSARSGGFFVPMKIILALLLLATAAFSQQPRPGSPPLPPGIAARRDVAYVPGGGPRQTLDVFFPEKTDKPLPLIVWIHGGAWRAGSKDRAPAMPLLADGFAVASVTYRFSQDAPFPAQIEDCKAAIRWLRAHAKELNFDPALVGVWGSSAGGHLVAMLGTAGDVKAWDKGENLDQSSRVQAVCDWFGPADLLTMGAQSPPVPPSSAGGVSGRCRRVLIHRVQTLQRRDDLCFPLVRRSPGLDRRDEHLRAGDYLHRQLLFATVPRHPR